MFVCVAGCRGCLVDILSDVGNTLPQGVDNLFHLLCRFSVVQRVRLEISEGAESLP
jgi:hypothetical protein